MHEMSIVSSLVDQVRAHVSAGCRVEAVLIEVGALEHLVKEMMETAWIAATRTTELEGAVLQIEIVPMLVRCGNCGNEFEPVELACLFCPACGIAEPTILQGQGVMLQSIEIIKTADTVTEPEG